MTATNTNTPATGAINIATGYEFGNYDLNRRSTMTQHELLADDMELISMELHYQRRRAEHTLLVDNNLRRERDQWIETLQSKVEVLEQKLGEALKANEILQGIANTLYSLKSGIVGR